MPCHSCLVSLVLLILSLWTDMSQGLPRSQATFARDMRGDVMYNVADAGKDIVESIAILSYFFRLSFALTDLFESYTLKAPKIYYSDIA